jgi:hypothetical protein
MKEKFLYPASSRAWLLSTWKQPAAPLPKTA